MPFRWYAYLVLGFMLVAELLSCRPAGGEVHEYQRLNGATMGTTYAVICEATESHRLQQQIDSLLSEINLAVSTYIPESLISQFNATGVLALHAGPNASAIESHFQANFEEAQLAYRWSGGMFDPTVGPLVNAWGFGWENARPTLPDSAEVHKLQRRVGMDKLSVLRVNDSLRIVAPVAGIQLDFSAVAKGYAVDEIARFLEKRNVDNYFVEVGGEVRVQGDSPRGDAWIVGVNRPLPEASASEVHTRIALTQGAMATSGNYRNFREVNGRKVWHTINPKTGYPEENNLLSVSIIHPGCATADARATACLVMGKERCLETIAKTRDTEALLIYEDEAGEMAMVSTPGFESNILDQ